MLELRQIEKSYGKNKVLLGVDLQLEHGIYGLLGLNGAGKTTLINILTGIMDADAGSVIYNGVEIHGKKSNFKNNLGFMPQYTTFYPNFTAREFLKYMCVMKKVPRKEHRQRIRYMLEKVNLLDAA
ncbi:MAG: ATP-binding cassette domain-containing protein, partial [Lachnospiraceae bacterium]|nr:ATP-binding cassette domain-containing protein [Lachnospiraceae bacterium]